MKRKLIVFALLTWLAPGWSQEIIEIKPFGEDVPLKSAKIGSTVKFKISNVNTFKISGDLGSKPLAINFEVPPIFNDLFKEKEDSGSEQKKDLTAFISSNKLKGNIKFNQTFIDQYNTLYIEQVDKIKEIEDKFMAEYKIFLEKYNAIQQQVELEGKLNKLLSDSIFIENVDTLKLTAKRYYKSSFTQTDDIVFSETKDNLDALSVSFTKMVKAYDELNFTLEKDSVQVTGMLKSKDDKAYLKVINAYMYQNRKKYFSDEMAFAKKSMEVFLEVKNRNAVIEKAQSGIAFYRKISSAKFEVFTDAEQITDDEMEFTPKLKNAKGKVVHEFKPVKVTSFGGWKVNFSSGYFLSFIGDENYGLVKDSGGNTIGAIGANEDKVTHALGGLMHVYKRCGNGPQFGMSFGLSLSTNQNLGFYAGPSLFFLEKNRLVLTTGYSFIKVKQLNTSNLSQIDGKYLFNTATDTEIKYDSVYQGALFVGLTYNLSK